MKSNESSSKLETILFGFTRLLAILGSIAGIFAIVIVSLNFLPEEADTRIYLSDINTEANTSDSGVAKASANQNSEVTIPENFSEYLAGDNEAIVDGWLAEIADDELKQDFVDNLSEIITAAEAAQVDVVTSINNYKVLKFEKITKTEMESYKELGQKAAFVSAIFALIIFIALMSLILVMLAIERNTRHS